MTLVGEPEHVEENGAILKEFLAFRDPGHVQVEGTHWVFSIAAGIFSGFWLLLATAGFFPRVFGKARQENIVRERKICAELNAGLDRLAETQWKF